MDESATVPDRLPIAPLAAGEVLATLHLYLSPLMLGALADGLGLGPERSGLLLAIELIVLTWVTLSGAAWVPRRRWQQAARWGLLVALLGNLGSLAATSFMGLFVLWVLAGAGETSPRMRGVLLLPVAMCATQLGQGCFWSFLQLAGERRGLSDSIIDLTLSASTFFLLIGVAAAGLLGTRLGRGVPLVGGILVNAASMAVAFSATTPSGLYRRQSRSGQHEPPGRDLSG